MLGALIPPSLKTGFYVELFGVVSEELQLDVELTLPGSFSYTLARTKHSFVVNGPFRSPTISHSENVLVPATTTFSFLPRVSVERDFSYSGILSTSLFLGLCPCLAIYLPILQARLILHVGPTVNGSFAFLGDILPSFGQRSVTVLLRGPYDTCHLLQFDVSGVSMHSRLV